MTEAPAWRDHAVSVGTGDRAFHAGAKIYILYSLVTRATEAHSVMVKTTRSRAVKTPSLRMGRGSKGVLTDMIEGMERKVSA